MDRYCEDCRANVLDEAECPWVLGYCVDCCMCDFHTTGETYEEEDDDA